MSLSEILSRAVAPEDARAVMEFEKMRFELSWRYFDFHARQRTQLFHFFIILAPFLFGGCFLLFKDRALVGFSPAIIASTAGALLSVLFFALDRRNRQMIEISERALMLLEGQFLYTDFRPITENGVTFKGVFTTEEDDNCKRWFRWCRGHTFLVGGVYWLAFLAFAVLLLYIVAVQIGYLVLPQLKP